MSAPEVMQGFPEARFGMGFWCDHQGWNRPVIDPAVAVLDPSNNREHIALLAFLMVRENGTCQSCRCRVHNPWTTRRSGHSWHPSNLTILCGACHG